MRYFVLSISLFAAACAGTASPAQAACTLAAVSVLPIDTSHGYLAFSADINGKTARMMLDTGATFTTMDRTVAGRFGIGLSQTGQDVYGIGGVAHLYRGRVSTMQFGGLNANGMEVGALDLFRSMGEGLDGVLGMGMMAAYDIDIDLAGKHVVLYEAEGNCRKTTVALAPELYTVPLESVYEDQQAMVMVTIEGRRFKAMLDSGAPDTVMYRRTAQRLGVDLQPLRAPGHVTVRGAGALPVAGMRHVFKTVEIGDLQINNMPIAVIDQRDDGIDHSHVGSRLGGDRIDEPGGEDLLIGADFMRKVHLWMSHSSHTLVMQFPPLPSVLPK